MASNLIERFLIVLVCYGFKVQTDYLAIVRRRASLMTQST